MAVYTTIDDPEKYFQARAYTGNGADDHAITFDGTSDMSPNLLWFKGRAAPDSGSAAHRLLDTVRGITQALPSHDTDGQFVESGDGISSVDTDGFTLQINSGNDYNSSSKTYVCWAWKESADAGFDIITYSGTGSAKNESHSLSATPHWILTKSTSHSAAWATHHRSYSATEKVMYLNNTNAVASTDPDWLTAVSSSTISLGGSGSDANVSGRTYVAYLWSEIQGYSKFGSYTGNGNANGPFVFCGFRPAFLMCKRTDSSDNWVMLDNKRDPFNLVDERLFADLNQAEGSQDACDFLSNGFKVKGTSTWINASGGNYVFMAFAEAPFTNSSGVPCNAR